MRFVPFLNVSYVKSGFHLMTVAPSFRLRGAGRRALSMSDSVCANAMAENASMPKTIGIARFMTVTSVDPTEYIEIPGRAHNLGHYNHARGRGGPGAKKIWRF